MPGRDDVAVSIQARSASDGLTGHVATGLLADPLHILVPGPPDVLLRSPGEFEVVLIPLPLGRANIERGPFRCLREWSREGSGGPPFVAVLELPVATGIRPQLRTLDPSRFDELMASTGDDVWASMEQSRAVAKGTANGPGDEVLGELFEAESRQRAPQHRTATLHPGEEYGHWLCKFLCLNCRPA